MYTTNQTFSAPPKTDKDAAAHGVFDNETVSNCSFIGGQGSETYV